jgi:site-specific recombinase XerD
MWHSLEDTKEVLMTIDPYLARLRAHLESNQYQPKVANRCIAVGDYFLRFLKKHHVKVEAAQPEHVQGYLREALRIYRRLRGHRPPTEAGWRCSHTSGIHMLLRLVQGQWPPKPVPANPLQEFHVQLCNAYVQWLTDFRGLAAETISGHHEFACRLLGWLGERAASSALMELTVDDIDSFVAALTPKWRRTTRKSAALYLRSFLRYLHRRGLIKRDLSMAVIAPRVYELENIPSTIKAEDVAAVLSTVRQDKSAKGRRDFAILTLLATYGLRAGEITALRLDDIDWRREQVRVRHSKTGHETLLPLIKPVGDALLEYLQKGRPKVAAREVFIRVRAPYRPFHNGSSLYTGIVRRLEQAGVKWRGKHGPHAFRHARAVSLLRAAVPAKVIGDVLGHRASASTAVYLKLATDDLRKIALDVPEVKS